jgi:DNA polymerase III subunit beta
MKNTFAVEQKSFLLVLSAMQPICTKRTTLDATTSILFQLGHKELVLKSTDLEISLQSSYRLEFSDIDTPRSFLVSGKRIFELVKELDGEIEFSLHDNQLKLRAGGAKLALNIKDSQDFPPFPERIENLMQFERDFILDMINKVAFLIPQNNATQALNGLFLEIAEQEVKMTTTDGHCLAQVRSNKYHLDDPRSWLLPRRAIFELKKIIEGCHDQHIFLGVCGSQLVFSGESFNFFTKLLADQFPQYTAILDKKDFIPARVDRSNFVKTLKRSCCLLSGQFIATSFAFDNAKMNVSMQNKEVGTLQEELPLTGFTGSALDVRFYAPYLLSGVQSFPQDTIEFFLKNASKPIIFESQDEAYKMLYLVMPVAPTHATQ